MAQKEIEILLLEMPTVHQCFVMIFDFLAPTAFLKDTTFTFFFIRTLALVFLYFCFKNFFWLIFLLTISWWWIKSKWCSLNRRELCNLTSYRWFSKCSFFFNIYLFIHFRYFIWRHWRSYVTVTYFHFLALLFFKVVNRRYHCSRRRERHFPNDKHFFIPCFSILCVGVCSTLNKVWNCINILFLSTLQ